MTTGWQPEVLKAIDEAFQGDQGVFLDRGTKPLLELRQMHAGQACAELPGAGNSVANQVRHLITTIAMHKPQFMGGDFPNLDWEADWSNDHVTDSEWQQMLDDLEGSQQALKSSVADPVIEQDQDYAAACIMVVTHVAFHIGQIRHAAAYAQHA